MEDPQKGLPGLQRASSFHCKGPHSLRFAEPLISFRGTFRVCMGPRPASKTFESGGARLRLPGRVPRQRSPRLETSRTFGHNHMGSARFGAGFYSLNAKFHRSTAKQLPDCRNWTQRKNRRGRVRRHPLSAQHWGRSRKHLFLVGEL